jgi:hypothetical protein
MIVTSSHSKACGAKAITDGATGVAPIASRLLCFAHNDGAGGLSAWWSFPSIRPLSTGCFDRAYIEFILGSNLFTLYTDPGTSSGWSRLLAFSYNFHQSPVYESTNPPIHQHSPVRLSSDLVIFLLFAFSFQLFIPPIPSLRVYQSTNLPVYSIPWPVAQRPLPWCYRSGANSQQITSLRSQWRSGRLVSLMKFSIHPLFLNRSCWTGIHRIHFRVSSSVYSLDRSWNKFRMT